MDGGFCEGPSWVSLAGICGVCGVPGVVGLGRVLGVAVRWFNESDIWGGPVGGVSWEVDGSGGVL